jgi:hypothetical protein
LTSAGERMSRRDKVTFDEICQLNNLCGTTK